MRLPAFLIIGAQKSGTTTLSKDLSQHPQVYIPDCKEVSSLIYDAVLTRRGKKTYGDYFRRAKREQICGDAATAYSRLPTFQRVPERAVEVLGKELKIIYIVRDPVDRIVSHHAHALSNENISPDINEAVRARSEFIEYSRYAMQIDAWLQYFKPGNIRIVHFETYSRDRRSIINDIVKFLGLPHFDLPDLQSIHNRAEERRKTSRFLRRWLVSKSYKAHLKPIVPRGIRKVIRDMITTPAPLPSVSMSTETEEWIRRELRDDQTVFAALLGQECMAWEPGSWSSGPVCTPSGYSATRMCEILGLDDDL